MSFIPPGPTLEEQLRSAAEAATPETWHALRTGILIRLDIPAQREMALRRCTDVDSFKTVAMEQALTLQG